MTINDQIEDAKIKYDINREVEKISTLLIGTINKQEYLTDEEILLSNPKKYNRTS